ncbi:MAG: polysulfide reductase NrfD, partial [Candidatus Latescibacterota bacterium]
MSVVSRDLGPDEALIRPLHQFSPKFMLLVCILAAVVACMFVMYGRQIAVGLGVTGLDHPVTWGFYIVNFVFFIGISHAGTLISAILRLSQAEWRRPITRMAEVITVVVLLIGGVHPILDLGRPDRLANVFTSGRLQSPLRWDVTAISAY